MAAVRGLTLVALVVGVMAWTGCTSSSKSGGAANGPTVADDLFEVAGLLRDHTIQFQRGPARLADVANNQPLYPRGYHAIQNGTIVVLWGVPLPAEGGPANVIAYEKKSETEGGNVLLQNGEIKQMSASEFASAPKAK
jgi:hypothetical protein